MGRDFYQLSCIKDSKIKHQPHQLRVVKHMLKHRGLLVIHSIGSGKTLTAITVLKCTLDKYEDVTAVVVAPTGLIENFKKEMVKYGMKSDNKRVEFYSITSFANKFVSNPEYLKGKLLIVDEAHNLKTEVKRDKSGFNTRKGLKSDVFLKASKYAFKVLLLTGTPVNNRPSEIINLISMIDKDGSSPSKAEFLKTIFDDKTGKMIDKDKFREYFENKVSIFNCDKAFGYPRYKEVEIEFEMDPIYYKRYCDIQKGESEKYKDLFSETKDLTVFFNGVRRASNNLKEEYSPKIDWIIDKLVSANKDSNKTIVYSSFLNAGMELISKRLERLDIPYLYISGKLKPNKRKEMVKRYNSDEIKILLISKAGGEGLDLKGTRRIIITEPPWNEGTNCQIVGRGYRFGSHEHLPEDRKKITIYKLYMKKPECRLRKDDMEAIDIHLKKFARGKEKIIKKFMSNLEKYSIEK